MPTKAFNIESLQLFITNNLLETISPQALSSDGQRCRACHLSCTFLWISHVVKWTFYAIGALYGYVSLNYHGRHIGVLSPIVQNMAVFQTFNSVISSNYRVVWVGLCKGSWRIPSAAILRSYRLAMSRFGQILGSSLVMLWNWNDTGSLVWDKYSVQFSSGLVILWN